jgi:hypothetical protein
MDSGLAASRRPGMTREMILRFIEMDVVIEQITTPTPELRDLIGELDEGLNAAYEPHQRHGLPIAQLFEPLTSQ